MGTKTDEKTRTRARETTKKPPMYRVVFHNDDYTTMEFVVSVLMNVFNHSEVAASKIMMHIHTAGSGIAGTFTREVAETKMAQTVAFSRRSDFPLEVTMEPE